MTTAPTATEKVVIEIEYHPDFTPIDIVKILTNVGCFKSARLVELPSEKKIYVAAQIDNKNIANNAERQHRIQSFELGANYVLDKIKANS